MQVSAINLFSTFGASRQVKINQDNLMERDLTVNNNNGIHFRPAAVLIKLIQKKGPQEHADVFLSSEDSQRVRINDSVMSIIMMTLSKGKQVKLETDKNYPMAVYDQISDCLEADNEDVYTRMHNELDDH